MLTQSRLRVLFVCPLTFLVPSLILHAGASQVQPLRLSGHQRLSACVFNLQRAGSRTVEIFYFGKENKTKFLLLKEIRYLSVFGDYAAPDGSRLLMVRPIAPRIANGTAREPFKVRGESLMPLALTEKEYSIFMAHNRFHARLEMSWSYDDENHLTLSAVYLPKTL